MIPDTEEPLDVAATLAFLLVVLAALTCSVRSKRPSAPSDSTKVLRVSVENRNFYDANVTVYCNGHREGRISQVSGNLGAKRDFDVNDSCQNVRFTVELIGPKSRYTSPSIVVSPPAHLIVFVGHSKDLRFTNYEVR